MRRIVRSRVLILCFITSIVSTPFQTLAFNAPPWDTGHNNPKADPGLRDLTPGSGCRGLSEGSPFEVHTGNFIHTVRDLYIPALGPDIELTRTYNSHDFRIGPFGRGWTFTYDIQLIETTDEAQISLICRREDGKRHRFMPNPDGTYTSPSYLFSTLVKHPDGTFTLTEKHGTGRRFNVEGRLTAVVDRNGNALSLTYDATGFLTTLTDTGGRTLQFAKEDTGKIASITDPAGGSCATSMTLPAICSVSPILWATRRSMSMMQPRTSWCRSSIPAAIPFSR
jgi:YD repeat-containing protein